MSLFESASLVVTPNGAKASKLYAIKPTSGAGDLSVTRATTATRVNSAGLIESVAVNVPRLDYTNSTCPSILVEPQRTNLFTYSSDLTQWSTFAASGTITRTANYAISPDGTSNATRIQNSGGNTTQWTYQNVLHSTNVFTIWVKRTGGTNQTFRLFSNNGTVTSSNFTATDTWQKFTLSISGSTTIPVGITTDSSGNACDILVWGSQLEAGSYATSYIPTTSASVTRNADVISKTGISSLIGQTEGTMYFDLKTIANNDFKRLSVNGGSYVNSIFFDFDNTNTLYAKVFNGGSAVATLIASGINIANRNKIAIAYKNNDFSFYVNGTQVSSQSSGSIPSGLANYEFSLAGNQIFEGNINTSALWKTRLTNAELAELTTL
jgi:hypothetical protein